ncbi:hypothetical protein [Methylobacterium durans]|uniref:Uncharacterized protein n=1 Tax=Methylobacterium durans TaxID=2202825 RepID=A0A2U8WD54_9HYPH|nr:hypothetical protein [Methylobacterium durans]AWN43370.1 hypothetical protein DK389_26245 [Methylobacterium durans]
MRISATLTIIGTFLALVGAPASASTMSAVCKDVQGLRVDDTGEKLELDQDRLVDVSWAYTGDEKTNQGALILQSSKMAGGQPSVEKALVQRMASGHWSFVSILGDAVWVHSIYPATGRLLVTQSTSGATGALSGKMMAGKCKVTMRQAGLVT